MFGLGAPELLVLVIIIGTVVLVTRLFRGSNNKLVSERRCLVCQYRGAMKTWLGNYNLPQFIALVLLFIYVLPGLIFIGWGWGKYKCPTCGTLAKNVPVDFKPD